jgi:hypothetical protein
MECIFLPFFAMAFKTGRDVILTLQIFAVTIIAFCKRISISFFVHCPPEIYCVPVTGYDKDRDQ